MRRMMVGLAVVVAAGAAAQAMELARQNGVIQIGIVTKAEGPSRFTKDIVSAALRKVGQKDSALGFGFSRVKSRSLLLDPLLSAKVVDIGLSWQKPDCTGSQTGDDVKSLCQRFFFSKPVFVEEGRVVVLRSASPQRALADLRVCTVKGFAGPVSGFGGHMRAASFENCFRLLASKQVDGVAGDQWRLRRAITDLKLADQLSTLKVPVYRRSYHAIIAKSHMRARTLLYYLNGGLQALRDSGEMNVLLAKAIDKRDGRKNKGEGE